MLISMASSWSTQIPPLLEPSETAKPSETASSSHSEVKPAPERLSAKQVKERVSLATAKLVEEVLAQVNRKLEDERTRTTRIDSKATSLLNTIGFSLTVAFTFGGLILNRTSGTVGSRIHEHFLPAVCFALSVILGLVAGAEALSALLVRNDYRNFGASAILTEHLKEFDQDDELVAVTRYRRFILPQLWQMAEGFEIVNSKKAPHVKRAQIFFALFLASLIPNCAFLIAGFIR